MDLVTLAAETINISDIVRWLILLVCVGLVFWLLWWLVSYIGLPAPFDKVARVILAVFAVLFLIAMLMDIAGHPIVRWSGATGRGDVLARAEKG